MKLLPVIEVVPCESDQAEQTGCNPEHVTPRLVSHADGAF